MAKPLTRWIDWGRLSIEKGVGIDVGSVLRGGKAEAAHHGRSHGNLARRYHIDRGMRE
jgi:hypothetical protein